MQSSPGRPLERFEFTAEGKTEVQGLDFALRMYERTRHLGSKTLPACWLNIAWVASGHRLDVQTLNRSARSAFCRFIEENKEEIDSLFSVFSFNMQIYFLSKLYDGSTGEIEVSGLVLL